MAKQVREKGKGFERICKGLCDIIPSKAREARIFPLLEFAGFSEDFDYWIGKRIFASIVAGLVAFIAVFVFLNFFVSIDFGNPFASVLISIISGLAVFAIAIVLFYLHLYYIIDSRASMAESVLPDFLLIVAGNMNAGMTPFAALGNAARKEFGPLSEEIKIAVSKSMGAESFSNALKRLPKRIKSRALDEVVSFFGEALKSGGKLSTLLETTAFDIRQTQEMQKELVSSTRMYVVFIIFLIVVGAPLLLAVSTQFLDMISRIQAENTVAAAEQIGSISFLSAELKITPAFMANISFLLLLGNALLAGIFIGVLGKGNLKTGIRYSPIIFIISIIVFIASNSMLGLFLGV